jgi:hypothetical protein
MLRESMLTLDISFESGNRKRLSSGKSVPATGCGRRATTNASFETKTDLWVISYIASNPVAAGLVDSPEKYPLFGSSKYCTAEILEALQEIEPWK